MRYTRNRQRKMLESNARMGLKSNLVGYGRLGKNVPIGNRPKGILNLDRSFMWLRIQYEDDKKIRNFWGISGTYARKIK